MFVPMWLIFLTSGTILAVVTLVWALKTRQFEDQNRARYLPLAGLSREQLADPPPIKHGASFWGIICVFIAGMLVLGLTLAAVIRHL